MVEKKLEDMTVKELRAEAKAKGFKNIGKLKKPALLEALGYVAPVAPPPSPMDAPTITPPPPPQPTKPKRTHRAPTKETVGEIERGVPIPVEPVRAKYPLEALKSGETFLVTCPAKDAKKIRLNIMNAARRITKKTGAAFLVLVWEQEKGVRCWRTDYVEESAQQATPPKEAMGRPLEKLIKHATPSKKTGLIAMPAPTLFTDVVEKYDAHDVGTFGPALAPVAPPEIPASEFKLFND